MRKDVIKSLKAIQDEAVASQDFELAAVMLDTLKIVNNYYPLMEAIEDVLEAMLPAEMSFSMIDAMDKLKRTYFAANPQ